MSGLKGMQLLAGFRWLALAAVLLVASTALAACGGEQATTGPESQPTTTQSPASGGQTGSAQPSTATSAPPATSDPERNEAATSAAPHTDTPQPPPTAAMTPEPSLEPEETAEKAEEPIATEPPTTSPPTLEPTPTPEPEAPQNLAHLFTLPNALDENPVSLKSFRGQKSIVLIFYRGFW